MSTPIYPVHSLPPLKKETSFTKSSPRVLIKDELYPASKASSPFVFPITKPTLSAPKRNSDSAIQYDLLGSLSKLWDVSNQRLSLHVQQLDKSRSTLDELTVEHAKMVKESAKRTQEGQVWSMLRKVGSCVLAAVSIFLGTTVASPILAGLLISSGILAIANLALTEAGLWNRIAEKLFPDDREKQKKFISLVPAAIGIASGVCGMVGSVAAFLTTSINLINQVALIASSAVNFAEGIASIGEGVSYGRASFVEAKVKKLDKEMFTHQNALDKLTGSFEGVLKLLSSSYEKASRIIRMSIGANEEITLQG